MTDNQPDQEAPVPETQTQEVAVVEEPEALLNPLTGELVPVGDIAGVGAALDLLREHKRKVDAAIQAFTLAAVAEARRQGSRTLHAGKMTIKVGPDTELEWDLTELVKLLDAGLPEERYKDLVKEEVSYKVNAAVAKQLEGANPDYAKIIGRARSRKPKRPSASVSA